MGHIDAAQPPAIESTPLPAAGEDGSLKYTKLKKPWSSIQSLGFVHQLDLVLPQGCADEVRQKLTDRQPKPLQFARVVMTLGQLLEGDFFKTYIKAGNVLMLSEGRPGQDNVFTLRRGHLTLFLERETYERAGLVGKPHGAKGNRGLRPRWVVEFDLNDKAMWPGKKGFDRLLHACKNVLNAPLPWLFCNPFDTPDPDPLSAFTPTVVTATPSVTEHITVTLPPLGRPAGLLDGGDAGSNSNSRFGVDDVDLDVDAPVELYEWLSLVRLSSPRVDPADSIDPYFSRYAVPGALDEQTAPGEVCLVRWRGFFAPSWACQTLLDVLLAIHSSSSSSNKHWFALSAASFASSRGLAAEGAECTFFRPAGAPGEYLLWDVHGHE